jgi:hypothetical protein
MDLNVTSYTGVALNILRHFILIQTGKLQPLIELSNISNPHQLLARFPNTDYNLFCKLRLNPFLLPHFIYLFVVYLTNCQ